MLLNLYSYNIITTIIIKIAAIVKTMITIAKILKIFKKQAIVILWLYDMIVI